MNPSSLCSLSGGQLSRVLRGRAQALARIRGSGSHPGITGTVRFYQTCAGVVVCAEVHGLPADGVPCQGRIFGFHIHEGASCSGAMDDPFSGAMAHFDRHGCGHPQHDGDLPPLFGSGGLALSAFLTDRFAVEDVIGRTVILHDRPDDLTTQPSGNSGTKIACGVIRRGTDPCR